MFDNLNVHISFRTVSSVGGFISINLFLLEYIMSVLVGSGRMCVIHGLFFKCNCLFLCAYQIRDEGPAVSRCRVDRLSLGFLVP